MFTTITSMVNPVLEERLSLITVMQIFSSEGTCMIRYSMV